jgi:type II secretion system protein F
MPKYIYSAKSGPGKNIQGVIEAETEQDAINKLGRMGYFPISVEVEDLSGQKQTVLHFSKVSGNDIVLFTRQLSSLTESGVNILNSLRIISNQAANKYLQSVLNDVSAKIKDGKSLSDSLRAYPHLFSGLYTSMIHSGEVGGNIEQTLKRLADFLEKEEEFKNSIRSALTYPAFILFVSAMTVIILLGFVIPRLVGMFEDMGQALPVPTKILITISGLLRSYWWILLAVIFMFVFTLQRSYRSPQGKMALDGLKLKIPQLGKVVLKTEVGRMMRTLSLLIANGIPIITSLDVAISVLQNEVLRADVSKFKEQIAGGSSLSKCLGQSKLFPAFVTNIVTVGEETGSVEKALMRVAEDYERDVDRALKTLTQMLEPVIILAMGLIVGFIVLSMLLPIFQMNIIVK